MSKLSLPPFEKGFPQKRKKNTPHGKQSIAFRVEPLSEVDWYTGKQTGSHKSYLLYEKRPKFCLVCAFTLISVCLSNAIIRSFKLCLVFRHIRSAHAQSKLYMRTSPRHLHTPTNVRVLNVPRTKTNCLALPNLLVRGVVTLRRIPTIYSK